MYTTQRQPKWVATAASSGRKTSWPVAVLAAKSPMTNPRLLTNQRLAIVALSTCAMQPVPIPTNRPQVRISCQGAVMNELDATAMTSSDSANSTVARTPKVCIAAPANGPMQPNRSKLSDIATEMVARSQPNASCRGTIKTPGVARTPADASRVTKTNPTTTHP